MIFHIVVFGFDMSLFAQNICYVIILSVLISLNLFRNQMFLMSSMITKCKSYVLLIFSLNLCAIVICCMHDVCYYLNNLGGSLLFTMNFSFSLLSNLLFINLPLLIEIN